VASKLGIWLGALSKGQLAEILNRRPDVVSPPVPRTLGELADRLQSRPSVSVAFHSLPQPAVQLVEVLQAFGGPAVAREQVAGAIGRAADDPDLDATLDVLALRALVWPNGRGELCMVGPLWSAFAYPLHLGPPAEKLLSARNATELRKIALALGSTGGRTKQQLVHDLVTAFRSGDIVRSAVAEAPDQVRELLESVAWRGPVIHHPEIIYGYGHSANPILDWALSRGLLVADGWQAAVMPGDVGMALRGADWRAPFTPQPPTLALLDVDPEVVSREAAAAAGGAVSGVTALLEACAAVPVTLLKAGGVGARELRRLGKAIGGAEEAEVRLWLELAYAAGLLGVADQTVLPTAGYDEWRDLEPADRLAPLLSAWSRLPAHPGMVTGDAALTRTPYGDLMMDLRRELMQALAELPAGRGLVDAGALGAVLSWRAPLVVGSLEDGDTMPAAIWWEARTLGVAAHGALSPLGRVPLDDTAAVAEAARALLPSAVDTVLFQADLTAVVPGTPTGALAALLDSAADRESSGGAAIWRFSPASIRRALDAGVVPAELLAELARVSAGGTALPQPLEYLVGDVARRHGLVRVRTVACVLRADDPALLSEIAATRALGSLGLRLLAPTVLTSDKPVAETLAALRSAGYAPLGEHGDGAPLIERAAPRRAAARVRRQAAVPAARKNADAERAAGPVDLGAIAGRLLASQKAAVPAARSGKEQPELALFEPDPDVLPPPVDLAARRAMAGKRPAAAQTPGPDGPAAMIDFYATQLTPEERDLLGHAVEEGGLVRIEYTNADGQPSARVIEPLALHGKVVEAWCHLRDEERMFALDRIEAVTPA
jgi:hypothetical protein